MRLNIEIPRLHVTPNNVKDALDNRLPLSRYEIAVDQQGNVQWVKLAKKRGWLKVARTHGEILVRDSSINHVTEIWVHPGSFCSYFTARRICGLLVDASELRTDPQSPDGPLERTELISLLSVYGNQFGSYTTLLWQVPALGLTAQAFLLTIALSGATSSKARIIASGISIIIALASVFLMHNQRGRAINHGELLRRVSEKLSLRAQLGQSIELEDAVPKKTDAQNVWEVDRLSYHGWMGCMILFAIADLVIIVSAAYNLCS